MFLRLQTPLGLASKQVGKPLGPFTPSPAGAHSITTACVCRASGDGGCCPCSSNGQPKCHVGTSAAQQPSRWVSRRACRPFKAHAKGALTSPRPCATSAGATARRHGTACHGHGVSRVDWRRQRHHLCVAAAAAAASGAANNGSRVGQLPHRQSCVPHMCCSAGTGSTCSSAWHITMPRERPSSRGHGVRL